MMAWRALVLGGLWLLLAALPRPGTAATVSVVQIHGAIGPGTAAYVARAIERAGAAGRELVILEMDTPGGLDQSMRQIIKAILASPVPVAAYVAPSGARAASAGTYILYASHVAAMAPGTNLGAATPVQIGGNQPGPPATTPPPASSASGPGARPEPAPSDASSRKQINDAVAYLRGLAQLRGRNVEWAERAVRESVSLPATEALQLRVIDLIAADRTALLKQLHGREVETAGARRVLQTQAAQEILDEPDWRARLLAVITDPSVALILMMIGVYGLFFEFSNPGWGVPGVLGGICLLLALYALQLLPVNYAGIALILLGLAFMIAEAFSPSFGIVGIGGVVAFTVGAVILMDTEAPGFGIPLALIVAVAATSLLVIGGIGAMAARARRRPVVTGDERLPGALAHILPDEPAGRWALFDGERWRVESNVPLAPGQQVRVVERRGLVLHVVPLEGARPSVPEEHTP
ncbi:MAG TPA: nodulation protein NfeD [Burkholderiaceae bacterium]|nr:nodulation protein NfeD [Burkholderiaceae bacterium]